VRPAALARAARMPADPRLQAAIRANRRAVSSSTAVRSKRLSRGGNPAAREAWHFSGTIWARFCGDFAVTWADSPRTTADRRNSSDALAVAGALAAREAASVLSLGAWLSSLRAVAAPMRRPPPMRQLFPAPAPPGQRA